MKNENRDLNKIVLQKIIKYCDDIETVMNEFNYSFELFISKITFQYTCSHCIVQIGELTTRLTEEFKNQHAEIQWKLIKAMRNIHAHDYESVKLDKVWNTLINDIPELKEKLTKILDEMNEK